MAARTSTPHPKVAAGAAAGAITTIIVWLLTFAGPSYVMPPEVAAALTVLLSALVAYLWPDLPDAADPSSLRLTARQLAVLRHVLNEAPDPPGYEPASHPARR